jgi:hypothetical protein
MAMLSIGNTGEILSKLHFDILDYIKNHGD